MNRYAVSYINFYDNELKTSIVKGDSELDALCKGVIKATGLSECDSGFEDCGNLEEAKEFAFNMDSMVDVIIIPE